MNGKRMMKDNIARDGQWVERRLIGRRGLQIALGILWLVDAGLQAEGEKFTRDYPLGTLAQSVMGAPQWVNRSIFAGINPFVAHWACWNLASILIQAAIGVSLVSGRCTRTALGVSFVWAAVIWWLGEGFGVLPTGFALMGAGAPGAAVLYGLIGGLAWPRPDRPDVDRRAWGLTWILLWVGAAFLHIPFVYPAGQVLRANLSQLASPSPGWLADTNSWFSAVSADHALTVTFVLAALELAIGVGWLLDRVRHRAWLGLGIALSLFYWVVFQQLGGIFTTDATDLNLGPMMVLLALAAWPSSRRETSLRVRPEPHLRFRTMT
jgi:hypothetical protein